MLFRSFFSSSAFLFSSDCLALKALIFSADVIGLFLETFSPGVESIWMGVSGLLLDFFAEVEGVVKELGEERFEAKLSFSCRGEFSCELDTDLFCLDRESFLVLSTKVCSTSTVDTCDACCPMVLAMLMICFYYFLIEKVDFSLGLYFELLLNCKECLFVEESR